MSSSWFRIRYAENAFRRALAASGTSLDTARAPGILDAVLRFYREARAQHTRLDAGEDVLRVSWRGADGEFAVTFSRRMQRTGNEVPPESLDVTLSYPADRTTESVAPGFVELSHPGETDAFATTVRSSSAFTAIARRRPLQVTISSSSGPR